MKRLLFFVCCLCIMASVRAETYYTVSAIQVGDNWYIEFWDSEDESDDVRVELKYTSWLSPDTLFVPATIEWGGKIAYVDRVDTGFFGHADNLKAVVVDTGNRSLSGHDGVLFSKEGTQLLGWPKAKAGTFTVGKDIDLDWNLLKSRPLLTAIEVDEADTRFSSRDGVLFTKDGTQLFHCPCGRTGSVTIAEGTTTLDHSFYCCEQLEQVVIPASVETIGEKTFADCYSLRSIYTQREDPVPGKYYVFWPSLNNFWLPSICTVYVPQGCKERYQRQDDDNWWSNFWIEEYEVTGITEASNSHDKSVVGRYTLDGKQATGRNGLQIVRRKDGTVRKEFLVSGLLQL